ncbi:XRE family transcriptional regulator [Streptomyces omiyaensis]|uniref:XRE family transcriptional regulator n=1 Tax=Streptomyces omiyaensis TaxID=68247 RepID=UPI0036F85ADD
MIAMAADHDQSARTLSDTVRTRRAELGLSLRAAEERCVDPETGTVVGRNYIERLEKAVANLQPPTPAQVRGLAAGLDLPLAVLQAGAGRQFYEISTGALSDGTLTFAARLAELEPDERDRFLAMLEAFVANKPKKAQ